MARFTELFVKPSINADTGDGRDSLGLALVNATYDHTGNGEGERHLSLAGAFASYTWQSGDLIYLKNAVGGVADGLYEIASKVDNDAILLVAASGLTADSTGDVDSSDGPCGDLEYLIEQNSFDGTNGTRLNVMDDGTEVLAAGLETALADTVTTPAWAGFSVSDPLYIQGCTRIPGDGGKGKVDCNGNHFYNDANADYVKIIDMEIYNTGANEVVDLDDYCEIIRCKIHTCTNAYAIKMDNYGIVADSYIYNASGGVQYIFGGRLERCYITTSGTGFNSSYTCNVEDNIIITSSTASSGIGVTTGAAVKNNSLYCSVAGAGNGISVAGAGTGSVILGNLIEGWSGSGGGGVGQSSGISISVLGGNAVYDCETEYDLADPDRIALNLGDNETLSESPFTDAAGGDFTPVDTGNVKEGALPQIIGGGYV